jgi:hypothetical protein
MRYGGEIGIGKGFYTEGRRDTRGHREEGKSRFLAALGMTIFRAGALERKAV